MASLLVPALASGGPLVSDPTKLCMEDQLVNDYCGNVTMYTASGPGNLRHW